MKAVRLADVKELLSSQAFAAWWAEHGRAVSALREARARHEDLVAQAEMMELRSELAQRAAIDAFSRSGEAEDRGRAEQAEAQALENQALELVAVYEEHRFRTSDLWYRLGGAEKRLEEAREALAAAGQGQKVRAQAENALREAEKEHERTRGEYEAFDGRRHKLWDEVEEAWSKSCERALLAAEHGVAARTVRRDAERLFKEAEERRTRAKALRADADAAGRERGDADRKRVDLLRVAGERFGCMAGDGWLYWRHRDDKRAALAVALADVPEGANLDVKALSVYSVGLQRGIGFLEPAREGPASPGGEKDRRMEVLLGSRKDGEGAPPAPSGAGV